MTRDDVLRMAQEAGKFEGEAEAWNTAQLVDYLERFAARVAAAEREACAVAVESMVHGNVRTCATAIRARGTP